MKKILKPHRKLTPESLAVGHEKPKSETELEAYANRQRKIVSKICYSIAIIGLILLIWEKYSLEAKRERGGKRQATGGRSTDGS